MDDIQQLLPTLVGDQIPLATEALQLLQGWTTAIWGNPAQQQQASEGTEGGLPSWTPAGAAVTTRKPKQGHGELGHATHPGH